jgi:hypothetical protein
MLLLVKKIIWWKRKCETVRCRDATVSNFVAKVLAEAFSYFNGIAVKCQSSMRNWLFGLPGWIICELVNLMSKNMISMILTFVFTCLTFFGFGELGLSMYGLCFLSRTLVNHRQGLHRTFSGICTKFDAVPLLDPSRNLIRPDIWLKIEGRKKSAHPASCGSFVHWLLGYASPIF